MPSPNKGSIATGWKRFFLFSIFPLLMLPFVFAYSLAGWWLLTVLDGFPGGFFKRHPDLTVAAIVIFACYLFIATAETVWKKMWSRFS